MDAYGSPGPPDAETITAALALTRRTGRDTGITDTRDHSSASSSSTPPPSRGSSVSGAILPGRRGKGRRARAQSWRGSKGVNDGAGSSTSGGPRSSSSSSSDNDNSSGGGSSPTPRSLRQRQSSTRDAHQYYSGGSSGSGSSENVDFVDSGGVQLSGRGQTVQVPTAQMATAMAAAQSGNLVMMMPSNRNVPLNMVVVNEQGQITDPSSATAALAASQGFFPWFQMAYSPTSGGMVPVQMMSPYRMVNPSGPSNQVNAASADAPREVGRPGTDSSSVPSTVAPRGGNGKGRAGKRPAHAVGAAGPADTSTSRIDGEPTRSKKFRLQSTDPAAWSKTIQLACATTFDRLDLKPGSRSRKDCILDRIRKGVDGDEGRGPFPCFIVERENSQSTSPFQIQVGKARILAQKVLYAGYYGLPPSEMGTWQTCQNCRQPDGSWWCFEPSHLKKCDKNHLTYHHNEKHPAPSEAHAVYVARNRHVKPKATGNQGADDGDGAAAPDDTENETNVRSS